MVENKFVWLAITFIWMTGLFGVLLALAYMAQVRRRQWDEKGAELTPHALLPLFSALTLFCMGLSSHAYVAQQSVSLWVALVWALLALFFLLRALGVVWAAWQEARGGPLPMSDPLEPQWGGISAWSGVVVAVLVVNLVILGWWGAGQLQANSVDQAVAQFITQPSHVGIPVPTATQVFSATQPMQQGELSSLDKLATRQAGGLAAQAEQVAPATPTPAATAAMEVIATISDTVTIFSPATDTTILAATPTVTVTVALTTTSAITATSTPSPALVMTVRSTYGANVRKAPVRADNVLTVLPKGATAPLLGRTADGAWFVIQLPNGVTGWIAGEVITVPADGEGLPVVKE